MNILYFNTGAKSRPPFWVVDGANLSYHHSLTTDGSMVLQIVVHRDTYNITRHPDDDEYSNVAATVRHRMHCNAL